MTKIKTPNTETIHILVLKDIDGPLKHIEDMPYSLYARSVGDKSDCINLLSKGLGVSNTDSAFGADSETLANSEIRDYFFTPRRICIIGARKHTTYGLEVTKAIIREIAPFNPIIVSGLATGIDTVALETAIEYNLRTIAVIGSGLDDNSVYPRENIPLVYQIQKSGGMILSEYDIGIQAKKWHFPARNRIMAGIADTIIVVEGTKKSGTLITARLGLEYGKEIISIPGSIFSPLSKGPLSLIEQGATPLTDPSDIASLLKLTNNQTDNLDNDLILRDEALNSESYSRCSADEILVLGVIKVPRARDEILALSGLKAGALQVILIQLDIKGLIEEKYGKIVRR